MTDIYRHPLLQQIYDLMQAIEACGASPELTEAVLKATALYGPVQNALGIGTGNLGLQVVRLHDELRISIGLNTLKTAMEGHPRHFFSADNLTITDWDAVVEAIVGELNREAEDGSTPVHLMLDQAFVDAVEQGCDGVEEIQQESEA